MSSAKGIPDRRYYGNPQSLIPSDLYDYAVQRHIARRAGEHYDLRIGDKKGLHSWAIRKGIPQKENEKRLAVHQPMHSHKYLGFEGTIPEGYGAGSVYLKDKGKVLISKVTDNTLHFSLASQNPPQRFVLVKPKTGKNWLIINTTPSEPIPFEKVKYKKIDESELPDIIKRKGVTGQAKIDGAASLVKILKDSAEVLSYRQSSQGKPIVHTERVFGERPNISVPTKYRNSILRGEIYGKKDGKVIEPQQLSAILNSTLENAAKKKRYKNIELRTLLFDVENLKGKKIDKEKVPYSERLELLKKIKQHLPDSFDLPQNYYGEDIQSLLKNVKDKKHELTTEGIVLHPETGKRPYKLKITPDYDVFIKSIFPGQGKYEGKAAGGFEYSLDPKNGIVGKVGTGLSDEMRTMMWNNPEDFIGRVATIKSQGQYPSGAYRAPSFVSLHES